MTSSPSEEKTKPAVPRFGSFKQTASKPDIPKFTSFKHAASTDTNVRPSVLESASSHGPATKDGAGLAVPKFASSRIPESALADDSNSRRGDKDTSRDSRRVEKHHRSQSHRSSSQHESSRRHHHHHHHHQPRKSPDALPAAPESDSDKLFFIDTKGDRLISKYGGLDRAHIPSYVRHGGGKVLGSAGRLIIHRDGARDSFSLRFHGDGSAALHRDGLRSKSLRIAREPVRVRASSKPAGADAADYDDGFIAIRKAKKRKRETSQGSSDDERGPSYRSIEGKAKVASFQDESEGSSSEDEAVALDSDDPLRWKSVQLSRRVKDHPEDVTAWLELVDHQDDLQRAGESIDQRSTADAVHSFSEIKLSMLESAVRNAATAEEKAAVLVRLMREGPKTWPSKVAAKRWDLVAHEETNNFELWRAHIDFALSNVAEMQFDSTKKMFLDRLRSIVARSDLQERIDCSEAIYVLLRATRFMHDSGYKELAVAAWQAVLEMNFFSPHLEEGMDPLSSFQDFWESEAARLGDPGAQGWKQFVASSGQVEAPEPQVAHPQEGFSTSDAYKAWGQSECCQSNKAKMPARTMDDGTEEDPFRVVIFSDLEPWLFTIPTALLNCTTRKALLDAFLIFCGLPPAFATSTWTQLAAHDQFTVRNIEIDATIPTPSQLTGEAGTEHRKPLDPGASDGPMAMSVPLLFSDERWFKYFGSSIENLPVDLGWLLTTLKQLIHGAGVDELALYYLGLVFAKEPSDVRKVAKALLKKYPSTPHLYDAYALAENSNGNFGTATIVLSAAMASPQLSSGANGVQLCRSWSWMEFEHQDKTKAVARLCSVCETPSKDTELSVADVSSTTILKARNRLSSNFHQSLYEDNLGDALIYAELWVWLAYLTDEGATEPMSAAQGNITSAIATAKAVTSELSLRRLAGSLGHERFLQWVAQILHMHTTRGAFRRAYIREQLVTFLQWFPRNAMFLALLERADSSLRVIDETRQLLYDKILVKSHDCVSSRNFSIRHESHRGNVNTVASAYEHALSADACKFNIGLWLSYVRFCYRNRSLQPKAKEVFYRALRHCPWSKEVMMEAFQTLIHDMKSDELRSVYNTITSKGLRVHVDLDDYVEQWQKGQAQGP